MMVLPLQVSIYYFNLNYFLVNKVHFHQKEEKNTAMVNKSFNTSMNKHSIYNFFIKSIMASQFF